MHPLIKQLYKFLFVDDLLMSPASCAALPAEPLKKKVMRDLARLTLLAYLLLVFNPVMPLIADKMAHTFWLEYHLIAVHGVYGNAHDHNELINSARQTEKGKSWAGSSKSAANEYLHLLFYATYKFFPAHVISGQYPRYKVNIPVCYPNPRYQPPRA